MNREAVSPLRDSVEVVISTVKNKLVRVGQGKYLLMVSEC